MKMRLLLPSLILPLLLLACSPPPDPEPTPAPPPAAPADTTAPTDTMDQADAAEKSDAASFDADQLGRYHWHLHDAVDGDGQPIDALLARSDRPLQLDFIDGRVAISNTCNRIGGSYVLEGNALHISHMMQTQMACNDEALMLMDSTVGERMPGDSTVRLDADGDTPRLMLAYADGDVLSFRGAPTAATRHGSEGEIVFMEVAAQTVPCDADNEEGEQCLQVRGREYGDDGAVVATEDEWRTLHSNIEDFEHQPGVRNVLRLKRYSPAGQDDVLVLDMVVESENER